MGRLKKIRVFCWKFGLFSHEADNTDLFLKDSDTISLQKDNSVSSEKDELGKKETGSRSIKVILHESQKEIKRIELRQDQ